MYFFRFIYFFLFRFFILPSSIRGSLPASSFSCNPISVKGRAAAWIFASTPSLSDLGFSFFSLCCSIHGILVVLVSNSVLPSMDWVIELMIQIEKPEIAFPKFI